MFSQKPYHRTLRSITKALPSNTSSITKAYHRTLVFHPFYFDPKAIPSNTSSITKAYHRTLHPSQKPTIEHFIHHKRPTIEHLFSPFYFDPSQKPTIEHLFSPFYFDHQKPTIEHFISLFSPFYFDH